MVRSMDPIRSAPLVISAPPGAATRETQPQQPVDEVRLAATAQASAPESPNTQPLWRKAVLAGALAASAVTGMAGNAMAAQAGPQGARTSAVGVLADVHSAPSKLQVTVLPERLPRIDLVRRTDDRHRYNDDHYSERKVDYSPVGIHLGDGIVQDTNGNLFLVPSMSAGWDLTVKDFSHVDIGKGDETVTRFGSTVHYNESSTKRHVIFERADGAEILSTKGRTLIGRDEYGNLKAEGPDGLSWELLKTRDGYRVLPGRGTALSVQIREGGVEVREGGRLIGRVQSSPGQIHAESRDGKADITRSEGGVIVEIDGSRGWPDHRLIKDGRITLGTKDSHRIEVDPPGVVNDAKTRYQQILMHLEAVEPGWAEKHPVVASVLEYAAANPALLSKDGDPDGWLQAGTAIGTGGGALASGMALTTGAQALSLAESAKALGAAALSAKAAAGAAAQAGNMAQAAALAQEAQTLAGQARQMGGEAMELGKQAKNTAKVARIMLGVAGALEIVDGGMNIHGGKKDKSLVEGAIAVTQAQMDELKTQLSGPELERAMEDYSKVMRVLEHLQNQAEKDVTVGSLKIGFGALMLVSALLGPEAPMALAIIGIGGTAGTTIYQHWDDIQEFLTGETQDVPKFVDLFPNTNKVIIDLGKPSK